MSPKPTPIKTAPTRNSDYSFALLVPDGVGLRNFVLGPFLEQALERSYGKPLTVLHAVPEEQLPRYAARFGEDVRWHPLLPHRDRPLPFMQRNSLAFAHMHWVDTFAMRVSRSRPVSGSLQMRAAYRLARWIGRAAASPRGISWLDRWHCASVSRTPEVEYYRELFRQIKPAVLFCSHQRPPVVLPPVLAARSLGIPTATFIFSWDNLTSKGRIAAPFDHYLVWSEHMRNELLRYYPDLASERVHVVGTPQFDPYVDGRLLWPRAEFFHRIGADLSRPLLCYSGGDAGNAPQDPQHVAILMELIRSGRIQGNPQVILRPTPVDDGSRYEAVVKRFPELIYSRPEWVHCDPGDCAAVMPSAEDVRFLANLTLHCDLNINFGSTMTLDFGLHDKPVVNIAFDVSVRPFGMTLWEYQCQFEHYQPVIQLGAARFARSPAELAEHVNAYLANPALDRAGRRRLVDLQVGAPLGQSSLLTLSVLERVAGRAEHADARVVHRGASS